MNSTLNRAVESYFEDIAYFLDPVPRSGEYHEVLPATVKVTGRNTGFERRLILARGDQLLEVYLHNDSIRVINQLYISAPKEMVSFSADTLASTIATFIVSRFAKLEV